jgi:hypothetical protein
MDMRTLPAVALLLALTACGSGPGGTHYGSAKDVATAAKCGAQKAIPGGEVTLYATDEVSCHRPGFVLVDWFKDTTSLGNFKDASVGAGYAILYGPNWAISCVDNRNDCTAMQKTIGGSLE